MQRRGWRSSFPRRRACRPRPGWSTWRRSDSSDHAHYYRGPERTEANHTYDGTPPHAQRKGGVQRGGGDTRSPGPPTAPSLQSQPLSGAFFHNTLPPARERLELRRANLNRKAGGEGPECTAQARGSPRQEFSRAVTSSQWTPKVVILSRSKWIVTL